jgi:hypothetical protein
MNPEGYVPDDRIVDAEVNLSDATGQTVLTVKFASGRMVQLIKPEPPKNYYSVLAKVRRIMPEHQRQLEAVCLGKGLSFP